MEELDQELQQLRAKTSDEIEPEKCFLLLMNLPDFPDPPATISNVREAAFMVHGGPCCLIREVILPPEQHPECPDVIFQWIEEARQLHNSTQSQNALSRLNLAIELWSHKSIWKKIRQGVDPITALKEEKERIEKEKARKILDVERSLEEAYAKQQQEAEEASKKPDDKRRSRRQQVESDSEDEEDEEDDEDLDEEERQAVAKERARRKQEQEEKKEEEARQQEQQQQAAAAQAAAQKFAEEAAAAQAKAELYVPEISAEQELEFQLFIHNQIGSVYVTLQQDQAALAAFWRAKRYQDDYVRGRLDEEAQQRADNDKSTSKKNDDDDNDDFGVPSLNLNSNKDKDHKVIPVVNPFQWCSTASAVTYSNLGAAAYHLQKYEVALRCLYVSCQLRFACLQVEDDEYIDISSSLNNVGCALAELKRFEESYQYFCSSEQLMQGRLHPIHPRWTCVRNNMEKVKPRQQQIDLTALTSVFRISGVPKRPEELPRPKVKPAKKGAKEDPNQQPVEEDPTKYGLDPKFFQDRGDKKVPEGFIPLRHFSVSVNEYQRMLLEASEGGKKKKGKGGGKGKGKGKKKK